MPFFDANKMVITVEYDDNMCLVGGSLRGVVNIFVRQSVTLCGASLRYRIIEGCSLASGQEFPDCYNIEYVLFGARSTKQAPSVKVMPGHYSYPFAIPIPEYAPPTQRIGGNGDAYSALARVLPAAQVPPLGPAAPALRIEHVVEVMVYVANSWKDKHQSAHAPAVVRCTTPDVLAASTNGREGHVRNGNSLTYPSGLLSKLFHSKPSKSQEQADCDIFVYNTIVSLSDSPFLHFAIRGKSNCPYRVELVRVVSWTPIDNPDTVPSQSVAPAQQARAQAQARQPRQPIVSEQIVCSTTMPPLDSPTEGIRGRLLISPYMQEHSVSFQTRNLSVSFYLTISLQYLVNKSSSDFEPMSRVRIPIHIFHGTFAPCELAAVGVAMEAAPVTGAVMGYDAPPAGEAAMFRPAGPVTDTGVTVTQWANPATDPVLLRPAAGGAGALSTRNGKTEPQPAASSIPAERPPNPLTPHQASSANGETDGVTAFDRPPSARHRYDSVAPSWVRSERQQPAEPIPDLNLESSNTVAPQTGPEVTYM